MIDVGVLELNQNPHNYFQDVEQAAFVPTHIVDGIGYSPDKMLQGRILSYPDAQRYRLVANYEQIPVNRCPFAVHNYQRDGKMRVDGNGGQNPNYYPSSFGEIVIDQSYKNRHCLSIAILPIGTTGIARAKTTIFPNREGYFKL